MLTRCLTCAKVVHKCASTIVYHLLCAKSGSNALMDELHLISLLAPSIDMRQAMIDLLKSPCYPVKHSCWCATVFMLAASLGLRGVDDSAPETLLPPPPQPHTPHYALDSSPLSLPHLCMHASLLKT